MGNQATINVVVEDVTDLRGANITLNFDASKLQYALSAPGGFIPSAVLMVKSLDNTNGTVTLDIAGLGASAYASGTGTIITVSFYTIATGNADITFGTTTLRDKDNVDITHTKGSGCSVTIN
jgi:membrane-bound ClpP family serine protease